MNNSFVSSGQVPAGDFKLYISDKFNEPNETNSTIHYHNQTKISIDPIKLLQGKGGASRKGNREALTKFQCPYLYLNFISFRGCSIRVQTKFPKGKIISLVLYK